MASVAECEQALGSLAQRLNEADPSRRRSSPDRSLTCTLRDLDVTFAGKLSGGELTGIRQLDTPAKSAQIALTMSSDDLIAMVAGELKVASAWASGRIRIDASPMDLLRLRSIL